jgi:hypothetical protein
MSGILGGFLASLSAVFKQTGTITYDVTGFGPVTSITDLETPFASQLPNDGFIKYRIRRAGAAGANIDITTRFKKNGSQLCQSAFIFSGSTLYSGNITSLYGYGNDDHDTLVMQGDGTGVLSRTNTNTWQGQFDRFRAAGSLLDAGSIDQAFLYSPSGFIQNSGLTTLISFPQTNSNFWYNANGTYKVNDFAAQSLPTTITNVIGSGTVTNNIFTMSDGVNCFIVGRYNASPAAYVEVDLSTGLIYKSSIVSYSAGSIANSTEEDANGTQLFAVNAANSYHANGQWRFGSGTGWRWTTSLQDAPSSLAAGNSTQTDMDVFGSIDTDNYLWFADWGHDDGGMFGVGNDSTLGIRKTFIYMTPSTYTA